MKILIFTLRNPIKTETGSYNIYTENLWGKRRENKNKYKDKILKKEKKEPCPNRMRQGTSQDDIEFVFYCTCTARNVA